MKFFCLTYFIFSATVAYANNQLFIIRVRKDVSESSILKKVKSDEHYNYYEVSEDELQIINEVRSYERTYRPKMKPSKRFQQKINDQFGITD
jgi:hypothetical protein